MTDSLKADQNFLDAIRRERAGLLEQIRRSQESIARSVELIRRTDELLAKSQQKP
jgi:hypothetical protein